MQFDASKIVLVGMPGSGKSTVGRLLGGLTGWPFCDLDDRMVQRWSLSIAEQFARWGEERFREREREALWLNLEQPGPFVLATGGGTPVWFNQMDELLALTTVVWLDVEVAELTRRLSREPATRPLLLDLQSDSGLGHPNLPTNTLEALYHSRFHVYEKAPIRITGNSDAETIARQILQILSTGRS